MDDERALERGRGAYAERAWADAYDALEGANRTQPLEQAYQAWHGAAESQQAARCAWWIGHNLLFLGQSAPARGWFARGRRLLERHDGDSVERGYLRIPANLE